MKAQPKAGAGVEGASIAGWPYCAAMAGTCQVYQVSQHIGDSIRSALVSYIFTAEEGSRLILQKNREGFTVQVTGAVQRSGAEPFGLDDARAIQRQMETLTLT